MNIFSASQRMVYGLSCILLLCFSTISYPCHGESIQRTNFNSYLTNHASVKLIQIEFSRNRFLPDDNGYTVWKGSLQSNGFYLECISNTPYSGMLTFGESTTQYWQTSVRTGNYSGLSVAYKARASGGSPLNSRQTMCRYYKQMLKNVLNCGIEDLDTSEIHWISKDEFSGPLLDWTGQDVIGKVMVTIQSRENGLPTRLIVISSTSTNREEYSVRCIYSQLILPPSTEIISRRMNASSIRTFTNIIDYVSFGTEENAKNGFSPYDVVPAEKVFNSFIIESNGLRYQSVNGGKTNILPESAIVDSKLSLAEGAHTQGVLVVRYVLIVCLLIPLCIIVFKLYKVFRGK